MSEILHNKLPPESPLASVIPLQRNEEPGSETYERLDFSDASAEVVAEYLFTQLRHPSRARHCGTELAADLGKLAPARSDKPPSPHTPAGRLVQIINQKSLRDIDVYDQKIEHDAVFQILAQKLLAARDQREMRPLYEATRDLAQLRCALGDETPLDTEWCEVINRLFMKQR